ncbi:MAG: hydrogenase nickel incorporation protein HypB [Planctomycetes bacterium]|nr:hydrogenase nickel incorporation protein HypB [Planctomycetota bacterium]
MTIEVVRKSLLQENDQAAQENRQALQDAGVVAFNIMGGAGCGKTTLLERVIPELRQSFTVAVLEGDLATTKDAARIDALGVPVVQLLTEGGCHLNATLVQQGLQRLPLADVQVLLIENVGNPICPANFDLGEHHRIAVLSVTEGDDKPAKYPYLFSVAGLVLITKVDLLDRTDFSIERASEAIHALDQAKPILQCSAKSSSSMKPVIAWLAGAVRSSIN